MDTTLTARPSSSHTHVGLEQRVLARLKGLRRADETGIAVGFSGGPDSLALAAVLGRVAGVAGWGVFLVHANHRLRPESDVEADECRRLAAALGLPCDVVDLPPNVQRRHPGVGIEEAARRERYVALAGAARARGTAIVAVAHHLDDQAETTLLHLLRGAGLRGASAMAESTPLTIPWWPGSHDGERYAITVWRPFLDEERAVVRAYAAKTGLKPIEDVSNLDRTFRRNRVRHELIPLLESIAPGARAALARYARIARDEDALLVEETERAYCRISVADRTLDAAALRRERLPIQRRIVQRWLEVLYPTAGVPLERVDAILDAAHASHPRSIEIGGGLTVVVQRGSIQMHAPTGET